MTGSEYTAFLGASIILAVTPGPDTFLMLKFGARNVYAGFVYVSAVALGVMMWAVFAVTGVAAVLGQFPGVRTALTLVGGCYLVLLGASALLGLRRTLRSTSRNADGEVEYDSTEKTSVRVAPADLSTETEVDVAASAEFYTASGTGNWRTVVKPTAVFRTGLISSLTNPKTGLFFLALLPPFLPHAPGLVDYGLLLATIAICILIYGAIVSLAAARIGRLLTAGSGPMIVDAFSGVVLICIGIGIVAFH